MRSWMRVTLQVATCIVLGAAVSIAVACVAAGRGAVRPQDDSGRCAASEFGDYRVLIARRYRCSPTTTLIWMNRGIATNITLDDVIMTRWGNSETIPRHDALIKVLHVPPPWADQRLEHRFGWPMD